MRLVFGLRPTLWELAYRANLVAARVRGILYRVHGYVTPDNSGLDILVGPVTRSFFEKGAHISLRNSTVAPPENKPNDFNLFDVSLGLSNPRKYQNPPERPSRFRMLEQAHLVLFRHSRIGPGFYISIGNNSIVTVGSWSYIGSDLQLLCRSGVTIGDRCLISNNVTLIDYDGHQLSYEGKIGETISVMGANLGSSAPIIIEDDVWIGANVTILKGVRIGEGSVIASGSIVRKDIPRRALVSGNPAQVIREGIGWKPF